MLVLQKAVGTILKIGINEIGGGSLANAGNRLFSSIEILIWKMSFCILYGLIYKSAVEMVQIDLTVEVGI